MVSELGKSETYFDQTPHGISQRAQQNSSHLSRRTVLSTTVISCAAISLTGCHNNSRSQRSVSTGGSPGLSGVDLSGMDPHVRPQDNLYLHVNGTWLKNYRPASDTSDLMRFPELTQANRKNMRELIEGIPLPANNKPNSDASSEDKDKVKTLYDSAMNTAALDQRGLSVLKPLWDIVDHAQTKDELLANIGSLVEDYNYDFWIDLFPDRDLKNSSRNVYYLQAHGLGLARDYLVEPRYKNLRNDYRRYLHTIYAAAQLPAPAQLAQEVLDCEQEIAQQMLSQEQRRDNNNLYNVYSLDSLQRSIPGLSLEKFIAGHHITRAHLSRIIVLMPHQCTTIAKIWARSDLEFLKRITKANILAQSAQLLSQVFRSAHFEFYGKKIAGSSHPEPRWEYALGVVQEYLPDALGKLYVAQYFPVEAKNAVVELVKNLRIAYEKSFQQSWLSPATKNAAIDKLHNITTKIGYPDVWENYASIPIGNNLFDNIIAVTRDRKLKARENFTKPVDNNKWFMDVGEVEAYNDGVNIVFPAGILQPPFFDVHAEPAVNYGAIGACIGHEISHSFDDQGAQYDAHGNLHNWWTAEDKAHFTQLTQKLIKQYNTLVPAGLPPEDHINGIITAGENAADLNGLTIAIRALRAHYNHGDIDGPLDHAVLRTAFYSWARVWRTKLTPQQLSNYIADDPHSPSEERVNQVVKNIDDFYLAFDVRPGDGQYLAPDQRVKFW